MIARRSGSSVLSIQFSASMKSMPSKPSIAGIKLRVPVSITISPAVTAPWPMRTRNPFSSRPSTRAWPLSKQGFSEFSKPCSRLLRKSITMSFARLSTAGKSTSMVEIFNPNSAPRRARCATRPEAIAAFVGMQPKFTHEPPRCFRSASPMRRPALARP